tara:strand:- start:1157 stop:1738 length:582 start_codon:yes stop_codon:yes gene_type:complete
MAAQDILVWSDDDEDVALSPVVSEFIQKMSSNPSFEGNATEPVATLAPCLTTAPNLFLTLPRPLTTFEQNRNKLKKVQSDLQCYCDALRLLAMARPTTIPPQDLEQYVMYAQQQLQKLIPTWRDMIQVQESYDQAGYGGQNLLKELWSRRQEMPSLPLIFQLLDKSPPTHHLSLSITWCAALLDLFQDRDQLH